MSNTDWSAEPTGGTRLWIAELFGMLRRAEDACRERLLENARGREEIGLISDNYAKVIESLR